MVLSGPHERRRRDFVGGGGGVQGYPPPAGNFEKLDCLRLHFVRSEGSMLQNQASKSQCKSIN